MIAYNNIFCKVQGARRSISMTKTLLIDLDGTLLGANTLKLHLSFAYHFVRYLHSQGIPLIQSMIILQKMKNQLNDIRHQNNNISNLEKSVHFFSIASSFSKEKSEQILRSASLNCFQKSRATLFSIPQAISFVEWAKGRYNLVLATNPLWPESVVHYRLGVANISPDNFSFITHAENMSSCKPYVQYYQELQKKLQLNTSECLMIGNSERKDGPAREIGSQVFLIKRFSDFDIIQKKLEEKSL